ncbi:hypothetical protein HYV50_01055 [Candidatus Pacearchaeota archaeon]|nr:hypothetical protein [Candidatus Pacearchaeota archaeon]
MAAEGFTYGGQTILSNPIFVETILPFLLVFTIVFAILQKSKILGEGKKQIDAIVSLVVGLLVISFGQATGIIVQLIPFLAVSLVIILVLMLLLGSFMKGKLEENLPKGIKYVLMAVVPIAVVIAVMYITNAWIYLYDIIFIAGSSNLLTNIFFIGIVIGAIIFVLVGSKDSGESKK